MRPTTTLVALATLFVTATCQEALQALARDMPNCSLTCFTLSIPQSACATNLTSECLCTDVALNAAVGACAQETCTIYELLQTKNVSDQGCGVPVRNRGHQFIVISMCGISIAILAFLLRLAASLPKNGRQMSWDDATMGLVVVLSVPPAIFAFPLVENGLGRDMWTLKDYQITNVLHFYYIGEIFYVLTLGVSKISILCFYLRVFPQKDFRRLIYGVLGVSVAYTIAFFFATTFQCTPVSRAWTQWDGLHEGTCNDIHMQGWIAAGINIVLDIIVMVLPLKHLAGLNMSLPRKLMVMAMFSVGIIVIIISALRLYTLAYFAKSTNITWDYFEAGYWSLLEINVSVVCGCMPAHRLVFSKLWPIVKSTFASSKSNSTLSSAPSGGVRSSTIGYKKSVAVSVKPKTEDAGDFVPLVDMDTGNMHHSAINEAALEHTRPDRQPDNIVREHRGGSSIGTDSFIGNDRLGEWAMADERLGKEYV